MKQISTQVFEKLQQYTGEITNPFDIPVKFVFLGTDEYCLSSPVIVGEKMYVVGTVKKCP